MKYLETIKSFNEGAKKDISETIELYDDLNELLYDIKREFIIRINSANISHEYNTKYILELLSSNNPISIRIIKKVDSSNSASYFKLYFIDDLLRIGEYLKSKGFNVEFYKETDTYTNKTLDPYKKTLIDLSQYNGSFMKVLAINFKK
jgi:hypothetical protein